MSVDATSASSSAASELIGQTPPAPPPAPAAAAAPPTPEPENATESSSEGPADRDNPLLINQHA